MYIISNPPKSLAKGHPPSAWELFPHNPVSLSENVPKDDFNENLSVNLIEFKMKTTMYYRCVKRGGWGCIWKVMASLKKTNTYLVLGDMM